MKDLMIVAGLHSFFSRKRGDGPQPADDLEQD